MDSNVVFAALLREGTTRTLLVDSPLELTSPEWMISEINRHAQTIAKRAEIPIQEVELLLALLTESIEVVPHEGYENHMHEAMKRVGNVDAGDAPFVALALAKPCDGIWTQNTHDFTGSGVRLWTTRDVMVWILEKARK